ncbi:hypothetical protein G3O06_20580 [Burkholderia sp. Ac-20345]|uniref:hypothetical protein n=1 Tax=Burkholderia sp. Ac-20345 TaxID=2703891 RepID=UPI00197C1218|nr:hypothetical protein [Burkholderia sp. Ac-20345]MBN3779936.1 hypothetical protein [Burkholderia sp. Ac-20345]
MHVRRRPAQLLGMHIVGAQRACDRRIRQRDDFTRRRDDPLGANHARATQLLDQVSQRSALLAMAARRFHHRSRHHARFVFRQRDVTRVRTALAIAHCVVFEQTVRGTRRHAKFL